MFLFSAAIPFIFALFIYFFYPFSDKLANISECIKNNKCPENESKSFFSDVRFFLSKRRLIFPFSSQFFPFTMKKTYDGRINGTKGLTISYIMCAAACQLFHVSSNSTKPKWKINKNENLLGNGHYHYYFVIQEYWLKLIEQ